MASLRCFTSTALLFASVGVIFVVGAPARAASSPGSSASPLSGNGHNVSFDGRVFVVTTATGWNARVLRPERVGRDDNGWPDVSQAFSESRLIQPVESCENALALCEENAADTPYRCNADNSRNSAGAFACYDFVVFDSNACANRDNALRRRALHLRVAAPFTADATVVEHSFSGAREIMANASNRAMRGIEPTVTKDGKLLVWQGHPDNDGRIDVLIYATSTTPCSLNGWDGPYNLSHMVNDPKVNGRYRLGERILRAADGDTFNEERRLAGFVVRDADTVRGAYPWLFPDGDAISFTSVTVPCRSEGDPAGCGPRRGGIAVLGYPTNWGLAHVDGAVNPDTDNTVRLFFSSPGPATFSTIPATTGLDVWPFFGSNTSNYTELVFDDGLDGSYGGVWLLNESVTKDGVLDRGKTPDTSGYFNTGVVEGGASFPLRNNAPGGKGIVFDGVSGRVRVRHDVSLNPPANLTLEATVRPAGPVSCDERDNWRVIASKGSPGASGFSLVLEDNLTVSGHLNAGGVVHSVRSPAPILVGDAAPFTRLALAWQSETGLLSLVVDGAIVDTVQGAPGRVDATTDDLFIGSRGARSACPDGDGAFPGVIDEVRLSTRDRIHAPFVPATDEGEGEGEGEPSGEGEGEGEGESSGEGEGEGVGGPIGEGEGDANGPIETDGCRSVGSDVAGPGLLLLLWRRRRR